MLQGEGTGTSPDGTCLVYPWDGCSRGSEKETGPSLHGLGDWRVLDVSVVILPGALGVVGGGWGGMGTQTHSHDLVLQKQ